MFPSWLAALAYRRWIALAARRHSREGAAEPRAEGLLRRLREWLIAGTDPVVHMRVGARDIAMPLSHNLPLYLAIVPTYDRVLPDIARRLRAHAGSLTMIDVGANVGDSAALVTDAVPDARLLCIEGSPRYFTILGQNVSALGIDATCVRAFCGDASDGSLESHEREGTGGLRHAEGAEALKTVTLDEVLGKNASFLDATILKVDTDGFDARVLRGAERFIARAQPVVFFEYAESLMRDAGDDPAAVFAWLAARGYTGAELFSNQGRSLGRFTLDPRVLAEAAARFVEAGDIHYLDVLAWPPRWADALRD